MDLDEVAAMLGLDRNAVYALVRTGDLMAIKTAKSWYVERDWALEYQRSL